MHVGISQLIIVFTYQIAVELASLPLKIRGYGHVKSRAIEEAKVEQQRLELEFSTCEKDKQ